MFEIIAVNGETYKFVGNYTMERFQRKISEEGWITCECGSILNTDHIVSFRKIKRMKSEPSFSNIGCYWMS